MTSSNLSDVRYPLFVAFAAIQANDELNRLLKKWEVGISAAILQDAAQFGFRRAMAAIYPGLPKHPFSEDPTKDIMMALRYQHEGDPEGILATASGSNPASTAPVRAGTDTSSRVRVSAASRTGVPKMHHEEGDSGAADSLLARELEDLSSRMASPQANPDSTSPLPGAPRRSPSSTTNLRRITRAPIFPWEKRGKEEE